MQRGTGHLSDPGRAARILERLERAAATDRCPAAPWQADAERLCLQSAKFYAAVSADAVVFGDKQADPEQWKAEQEQDHEKNPAGRADLTTNDGWFGSPAEGTTEASQFFVLILAPAVRRRNFDVDDFLPRGRGRAGGGRFFDQLYL